MAKNKIILIFILWFGLGYFASAMWTADFYEVYGPHRVETKGSAARSSLLWFVAGPIGAFAAFSTCNHPPMWDWPIYLFDYKDEE